MNDDFGPPGRGPTSGSAKPLKVYLATNTQILNKCPPFVLAAYLLFI